VFDAIARYNVILACDAATPPIYGDTENALRMTGRPIPEYDVWIAALALQHGLTLLTRDAHVNRIEYAQFEQWYPVPPPAKRPSTNSQQTRLTPICLKGCIAGRCVARKYCLGKSSQPRMLYFRPEARRHSCPRRYDGRGSKPIIHRSARGTSYVENQAAIRSWARSTSSHRRAIPQPPRGRRPLRAHAPPAPPYSGEREPR
jgi:hypothetical protein